MQSRRLPWQFQVKWNYSLPTDALVSIRHEMRLQAQAYQKVSPWHESASAVSQRGPLPCFSCSSLMMSIFHARELFFCVKSAWKYIQVVLISPDQLNSTTLEKDYALFSFLSSLSGNPKVFFFLLSNTAAIPAFLTGCFVFTNTLRVRASVHPCPCMTDAGSVAPAHVRSSPSRLKVRGRSRG